MSRTQFLGLCLSLVAAFGQTPSDSKIRLDRAVAFEAQGQFERAGAEFKAAIELAAKNADTIGLARALDLACDYYQDGGHAPQAESCLRRLLATYQQMLGADHLSLNRIVNRLACLYIEIGQRGKAERLGVAKWLARLESEDPTSNDRVDLTGTMAALEVMRGNPAKAAALNTLAWEILEKRGAAESNSGITVLNNLSIAYSEMKKYKDAAATLERALRIGEKAGFNDTLPMAATHANLSKAYEEMDMLGEAERHMAVALRIIELRCGKESTRTAAMLASYVPLLRKLGRKDEARATATRARKIAEASGFAASSGHSVDIGDLAGQGRRR